MVVARIFLALGPKIGPAEGESGLFLIHTQELRRSPLLLFRRSLDGTAEWQRERGGRGVECRTRTRGPERERGKWRRVSLSTDLISYLESLTLAGGDCDGEPFTVLPWERRFLLGAWKSEGDAALSVGRGNGKSALVAGIATAMVDPAGPLHGRRREVIAVAATFEQARIIFEDVRGFLSERYDLSDYRTWRKQDTGNRAQIEHRASGARVRCIGSNPGGAHGLRPALVLADEPAQWDPAKADRMVAALRTGLGKVPGSRLIALGTRPADDGHWFGRMLRTAPYSQIHASRKDDPPFWKRTLRRANPSWNHLPSLRARIRQEIADAKIDPDALASFKALRLNMGTSDVARSVLLDAETWKRAQALGFSSTRSVSYVLGLDLGTSAAMSAGAAYFRSGELEAVACFPELPSLAERGLRDGVGSLYQKMADRGELLVAGQHVSDVRALLVECRERWGSPQAVVIDRWREAELREHLEALRFPMAALVTRGQGYKDGGADVREFRAAVLGNHVRAAESLLLTSALSEARVIRDPAGNAKLSKATQGGRRHRARDDAAAAAILAVSAGRREWGGSDVSRVGIRTTVV